MYIMELFMHNVSYDSERKIIRLKKAYGVHWSCRLQHLGIEFEKVMTELSKAVIARIPLYFDKTKRKSMKNLFTVIISLNLH